MTQQHLFRARALALTAMAALVQVSLWAQDGGGSSSGGSSSGGSSSSTTTTSSNTSVSLTDGATGAWYNSPWVWVIGAAVFILLLVALLGGGSRRRTVTTTTTDAGRSGDRVTVQRTTDTDEV
ncbi:hypothetical protein [Flaviaesturariibacter amylovorans]|uniref:Uncharacterized protein n=1 Tax=Flaviaesturariibacter amylovorans TaxID=1084520 RepID=A0ABP8H1D3_9BACT